MEQTILQFLQDASISVVSIAALVYLSQRFLMQMDKRAIAHDEAMKERSSNHEISMLERENQIRIVESHVRTTVLTQLSQNTIAMNDTAKMMERVMTKLDKSK